MKSNPRPPKRMMTSWWHFRGRGGVGAAQRKIWGFDLRFDKILKENNVSDVHNQKKSPAACNDKKYRHDNYYYIVNLDIPVHWGEQWWHKGGGWGSAKWWRGMPSQRNLETLLSTRPDCPLELLMLGTEEFETPLSIPIIPKRTSWQQGETRVHDNKLTNRGFRSVTGGGGG